MLNFLTATTLKNSRLADLDAGLKACLSFLLTGLVLVSTKQVSLSLVFCYLVLATVLLGSNFRFLGKNAAAYALIFLLPYFFGLLFSLFMAKLFSNAYYSSDFVIQEIVFRMVRIFYIWYIGSLYIASTPLNSILGLLKSVFSPLSRWGVPVANYLKIIMCIVLKLTESVSDFKNNDVEQARLIFQTKHTSFKTKLKGLSNLLVLFIANSLQKTDEIQQLMDQTSLDDFTYHFKVTRSELLTIASFMILLLIIIYCEAIQH
ncbi:conserved membrane hypothetical protein [Candidatus Desulfosporosinus infrequens]|uniref:Uncharacterized protein n=1 Tax=Candidatus Desulfosporosinus infrequens TaxID=2043169 RepID=A0A2U3KGB4_9FIRM|nr:conserved membrane hypothetical protein [Candidatus Desulfosporosinus infrequens]